MSVPRRGASVGTRPQFDAVYYFAKHGAQDAMFDHAKTNSHRFCVVHDNTARGRSYASYPTVADFKTMYNGIDQSDRHFFELIRPDTPVRFYLDVEFEVPRRDDIDANRRLELLLRVCANALKELLHVTVSDWVVQDSSRNIHTGWKHSYHVNLTSLYFANNETVLKRFMGAFRKRLDHPDLFWLKAGKREPIVDFATNTRNRALRLPLSSKKTDPTATPLQLVEARDILDAFVTVPPTPTDTVIAEGDVAHLDADNKRKRTANSQPQTANSQPAASITVELTAMLRKTGDATSRLTGEVMDHGHVRVFPGRIVGERVCPHRQVHDSNNFFLTVRADGAVHYKCHGSTKPCSGLRTLIGFVRPRTSSPPPRRDGGTPIDGDADDTHGASQGIPHVVRGPALVRRATGDTSVGNTVQGTQRNDDCLWID